MRKILAFIISRIKGTVQNNIISPEEKNILGGRTGGEWTTKGGDHIETTRRGGYNVLVNGTNKYLNFNTISGLSGYGVRDNGGTLEVKNSGGSWSQIGGGGSGDMTKVVYDTDDNGNVDTSDALIAHAAQIDNPHSVTADNVGLGNVDNTSDVTKNSATATLTNKTIDGDNNTITNVASDDVNLNTMSGVSRTLTDYMNTIQSSGYISGGDFTDNGDGTAKISAGAGFIKTTNAVGGSSLGITWAEDSSLTMVANSTNYIYIDYNAGTPIVKTSTTNPTDTRTTIHLGKIYRNGSNVLHLFKAGSYIPEHTISNIMRWVAQYGEVALTSGGIVAETGARYIIVSAATLFGGIVKTTTSAVDTSGADTFTQFYTDGVGGWNESDISQINNIQYDNGGTLTNLSNNRHRTDFVYLDNDGHVSVILGTNNDFSLSTAQAVTPPSSTPSIVSNFATLIAKIIVKEGETNLEEVDNLETGAIFSTSGTVVHNETTSIQGGTADEYYHLTDAQHTVVANTTGVNTGDQDLSSYATKTGIETLTNKTLTSPVINTPSGIVKGDVGLGNVDNTSDATKNSATATLTNKRITKRTGTTTSSATPTINSDNYDMYIITAQTEAITSFTTNLSGTPESGDKLWIAITGTGAIAITWGADFENGAVDLPTTTVTTERLDAGFIWNATTSKWRCMAQG